MPNEMTAGALQTAYGAFSPAVLHEQIQMVQHAMSECMVKDTHYGVIPGCGDKPTLLKPGAEKLCFMFRLAPKYRIEMENLGNGHREYRITCELSSIQTGTFVGEGVGSASTMEAKYRYRQAERVCPACGKPCIIKGKKEYDKTGGDGGWLCFKKKGGCGATFGDAAKEITEQQVGRMENPDIADCYNSCLKIAKKRASVDATLTATAASDIFAQDLEDLQPQQPPPQTAPEPNHDAVSAWKSRINGAEDDAALNALLTEFKGLSKAAPERKHVWELFLAFARDHGCIYDKTAQVFVSTEAGAPA